MSKRAYDKRLKTKRDAAKAARKRAERIRKIRVWTSVAASLIVVLVLFLVLRPDGGTKPSASPTNSPTGAATGEPLPGCTQPSPAPTPNGKKYDKAPPNTIDPDKIYVATFETSCGAVKMRMDPKKAPASVNNFVFLARDRYFDGTTMPRVQNNPGFGIIQAGSQTGTISGGVDYTYEGETPPPGSKYTRGVVAMANSSGPSTNGSQFFFVVTAASALDTQPNYSIFGMVEDEPSLAVLDKILTATGKTIEGGQLGITPDPPIYILKVTIEETARS